MKTLKGISLLTVAGLLLVAASSASGQDALLRLNYQEGDVYSFKIVNLTTQEQMGMEIVSEQTQYMDHEVTKVEGDVATLKVKITRVVMKSSNPMSGEMSFDSDVDSAEDNPQLGFYSFMVGKSFTMKSTTRGKILEVSGFTKIGEELLKKMEDMGQDNPMFGQISGMLKKIISDDFMKKTMSQSSTSMPEDPVKVGTTWNEESNVSIPLFGDLDTKVKNTVTEIAGGIVKVNFEGTMESRKKDDEEEEEPDEEDPMAAMLKMMKITGGKISGSLEFDTAMGAVKKRVSKNTMTLELMGQEMPMVQEQTTELIKKGRAGESGGDKPSKEDGF